MDLPVLIVWVLEGWAAFKIVVLGVGDFWSFLGSASDMVLFPLPALNSPGKEMEFGG